jgi:predicted amidophosphoribosyltransferase
LYQLKYCKDKSKVDSIAKPISDVLLKKQEQWHSDLIIPVPPSDTERAYQPVEENVLIFDDIYRSGETLNAISEVIKSQGNANNVYVLSVTKTRVKK